MPLTEGSELVTESALCYFLNATGCYKLSDDKVEGRRAKISLRVGVVVEITSVPTSAWITASMF